MRVFPNQNVLCVFVCLRVLTVMGDFMLLYALNASYEGEADEL